MVEALVEVGRAYYGALALFLLGLAAVAGVSLVAAHYDRLERAARARRDQVLRGSRCRYCGAEVSENGAPWHEPEPLARKA